MNFCAPALACALNEVNEMEETVHFTDAERQVFVCCVAKVPQHGGALKVAGVVISNWKANKEDSFVKVVDHLTARSAPPTSPQPAAVIASITYVSAPFIYTAAYLLHWRQI